MARAYSWTVIKTLFATSCNTCAMDGCEEKLTDPSWKQVKADIAHIRGERPGSARYDPSTTADERNAFDNLMLLCPNCHRLIDRLSPDDYPVERLTEIKQRHEERCSQRWASDNRLDEVTELLMAAVQSDSPQAGPAPRLVVEQGERDSISVVNVSEAEAFDVQIRPAPGSSANAWVSIGDAPARLSPGARFRAGASVKSLGDRGPFVLHVEWSDRDGNRYDGEFPY